jgi:signal transduction histidine kinase
MAKKGILDLRKWKFAFLNPSTESGNPQATSLAGKIFDSEKVDHEPIDGEINLDGEWEFYWNKLISPREFIKRDNCIENNSSEESCLVLGDKSIVYSNLPKMWTEETENIQTDNGIIKKNLPSEGYATYRLQIYTNNPKELGIRIPYICTAYNLYANGKLIAQDGKVGKTEEESKPGRKVQTIIIPIHEKKIDIVIQISNFENNYAGIWASLKMGDSSRMIQIREKNLFFESAIAGILFIMGFYHLAIYSLRQRDKSPLWFGLFCLDLSLRTTIAGENYLLDLIPSINYALNLKLDYLTMPVGGIIFVLFMISLYPEETNSILNKVYFFSSLFFIFILIVFSPRILTSFFVIIQIYLILTIAYIEYIIVRAMNNKKEYAKIVFYGGIFFMITVINDILYMNSFYKSSFYASYGLVIFLFSQSYILSAKSSKAFSHVEELSQSLIQTNKDLQGTKDRATKAYLELEASQKKLVQSDKMITLGTMVAGIAHEINTPLGAIKANSENIQFSISQYLNIIQPDNNLFTKDELKIILEILELSGLNQKVLSTKEARSIRKSLITVLHKKDISLSDREIDIVIDLGFGEKLDVLEVIFQSPRYSVLLDTIQILNGLRLKAKVIETSAGNVSRIVRSLKSFMHFSEKDEMVLSDLIGGIESVLIILNSKLKMGIEVIKNYEEIPHIYCYIDELNQIWTNLIHNSIQAMNGEGKIIIEIQLMSSIPNNMKIDFRDSYYMGKYISISIEDNGPGIPSEIQTKIFEAFFTTKPMGEGSGLGLHIISKILEKHKGALNLLSEPGKTKFVIHIPSLEQDFSMK